MLTPDPEKFAALPEAFNALGRNRFGERWTGTELAARNLPPPKDTFRALKDAEKDADIARARAHQELDRERRAKVEKAKKAASRVGGGVRISRLPRSRPPMPEEITQEQLAEVARLAHLEPDIVKAARKQSSYRREYKARARRDEVENELRKLLYGKRIPATLLNNHDGKLVDIPPEHWLADKFTVDFTSGQAEWADLEGAQRVAYQGFVLIDRRELDQAGMGTQQLTISAVTDCKKWLEAKIKEWNKNGGPVPRRDDLLKQAKQKFPGLSTRGFLNKAWPQTVPEVWSKRGPKLKR